ncbi:hypothetical protein Taro_041140 [Colocasia esculenta]|uniref:DUF659 domain-containing protein n=1 Tax=Colocasia esculenta TaxID=4460 RepID=A0A843WWG7_COLES|nr:hypothetical protein [Colocasia esculenta]
MFTMKESHPHNLLDLKAFITISLILLATQPLPCPKGRETQNLGKHVHPPTVKELAGVYREAEVEELKNYIVSFKRKWQKYGITFMRDGWSGTTKNSLINFLVYYDRQVFHDKFLMKQMVAEIGEEYIVQVVMDNGSNYKKVGEELMKTHPQNFEPLA